MHIQTHILSGWCIADLFPLNPRQRLCCMIAASVSDIDGLGFLISEEQYWNYHHTLGHCLIFGIIVSIVLTSISKELFTFPLYFALFHLHLLLDVLGSGSGWKIYYFWPFSSWGFRIDWGWELFSWQNIAAFCALFAWTIWIARRHHRTPLEVLFPSLDRKLTSSIAAHQN